jgi:integral membrane protein
MLRTPIGRLRVAGFLEGASFLLLLFVAMPLKYFADKPEAVFVCGMLHGVLFVLYLLAIAYALIVRRLTFKKSLLAFIAAFVPFGPFFMDRGLR